MNCSECKKELTLDRKQKDGSEFYRCINEECNVTNFENWSTGSITYRGQFRLEKLPHEDHCPRCDSKLIAGLPVMDVVKSHCSNNKCNAQVTYWMRGLEYLIEYNVVLKWRGKNIESIS